MELNERINAIEGDVKLVKTEIKQVLVDLRETMNNLENPFVNVEQLRKVKDSVGDSAAPEIEVRTGEVERKEERALEGVVEPVIEPVVNQAQPVTSAKEEKMKKLAQIKAEGAEKIGIFMLTQLMKWADTSLSNIGKEKLNEIIGLYDLTGRLPKETKGTISKIEDLSNVTQEKEKIEMKDCILAIYQLDRILTGETGAQAPLMLSEEELEKWLKA
ncbi:MAG: hypothetical protein KAV25_04630 [Methanophagales archaeon]|nr:hypothetical protein [Methanophagales archaeon]